MSWKRDICVCVRCSIYIWIWINDLFLLFCNFAMFAACWYQIYSFLIVADLHKETHWTERDVRAATMIQSSVFKKAKETINRTQKRESESEREWKIERKNERKKNGHKGRIQEHVACVYSVKREIVNWLEGVCLCYLYVLVYRMNDVGSFPIGKHFSI